MIPVQLPPNAALRVNVWTIAFTPTITLTLIAQTPDGRVLPQSIQIPITRTPGRSEQVIPLPYQSILALQLACTSGGLTQQAIAVVQLATQQGNAWSPVCQLCAGVIDPWGNLAWNSEQTQQDYNNQWSEFVYTPADPAAGALYEWSAQEVDLVITRIHFTLVADATVATRGPFIRQRNAASTELFTWFLGPNTTAGQSANMNIFPGGFSSVTVSSSAMGPWNPVRIPYDHLFQISAANLQAGDQIGNIRIFGSLRPPSFFV